MLCVCAGVRCAVCSAPRVCCRVRGVVVFIACVVHRVSVACLVHRLSWRDGLCVSCVVCLCVLCLVVLCLCGGVCVVVLLVVSCRGRVGVSLVGVGIQNDPSTYTALSHSLNFMILTAAVSSLRSEDGGGQHTCPVVNRRGRQRRTR
mmetsp:Transcript_20050/g.43400  ORF Transcript_20050/g.43400 Transcript_20050/m.43400 type:complete len:147 (+) Transcript_20050:938-1378(+)